MYRGKINNMKASHILFSLFLVISSFGFAGNGESALDRLMNRKISYPEALRSKGIEATVKVKIRVSKLGSLEVVSIESDSPEMREAVEKQVKQLKFSAPANLIGKEFDYSFRFQVQH